MKPAFKQPRKKAAFTIIELLTVMSIIVILISLLVPALNMVKRYAKEVRQKARFHSIDVAVELFKTEFEDYPPSDESGLINPAESYCGAMKLCEAMMGQDLLGFHPASLFRSDGTTDGTAATQLYPDPPDADNLKLRKGPYLQLENANAYRLESLYANTGLFDPCDFVLCDVYTRVTHRNTGKKVGMPILYYRADTSKTSHDRSNPDNPDNIYNYHDNHELVRLGMPWDPGGKHKLFDDPTAIPPEAEGERFYIITEDDKIEVTSRPYRVDSYILISDGFDGEYGTPDDVFNFER